MFSSQFSHARLQPEATVLHRRMREQLETFREQAHTETGMALPDFIAAEFDGYLRCGVLAHGFLRLRCQTCREIIWWARSARRSDPAMGAVTIPLRVLLAAQPKLDQ